MEIDLNKKMDKRKNIIFFFLGSLKVGGTEVVATRVQKELTARGFSVFFVLLTNKIELPVDGNAPILHLNTQNVKIRIFKIIFAYFQLWKYYLKYKPERIVSFSSGLNILLMFSFIPKQVYTIDTNLFWVRSMLYRRRLIKITGELPFVKKIIVPSNELRLRFKEYLNPKSFEKLVTIYNPIAFRKKTSSASEIDLAKKPVLISVGRLTKSKGFEQLIRCFSMAKIDPEIELHVLGSGDKHTDLQNLIMELKMDERIKLLGFKENPQDYICKADALILNSSFESFGNVLVEGLSLGVPVISNDCDYGPREIILSGFNGLLYDNSKDDNLIRTIEDFFNDKDLQQKLKSNTQKGLERFKLDVIADKWIQSVFDFCMELKK